MTTYQPARGLRGDFQGGRPGDTTGRKFLAQAQEKTDRVTAINRTINSLREDPVTIIPEKGGAAWAIPTHVVELIRAAINRGVL